MSKAQQLQEDLAIGFLGITMELVGQIMERSVAEAAIIFARILQPILAMPRFRAAGTIQRRTLHLRLGTALRHSAPELSSGRITTNLISLPPMPIRFPFG